MEDALSVSSPLLARGSNHLPKSSYVLLRASDSSPALPDELNTGLQHPDGTPGAVSPLRGRTPSAFRKPRGYINRTRV